MKNGKHGNSKLANSCFGFDADLCTCGFDSDLCGCGCANLLRYITVAERKALTNPDPKDDNPLTDARALAHARAVNARAELLDAGKEAA